jgi:hypothetical protein
MKAEKKWRPNIELMNANIEQSTQVTQCKSGRSSPLSEMDQLVRGERMLEIFWPDAASRPSMAWLRKQVKARQIPFLRRGRRVWYIPRTVKVWLELKETKPTLMLQHEHDVNSGQTAVD